MTAPTKPSPKFLVSLPRSGQHYVARNLARATQLNNFYCENYSCNHIPKKFLESDPCPTSLITKTHDFRQTLTRSNEHVVLWRKPSEAIQSWYLLHQVDYPDKMEKLDLRAFAQSKITYFVNFFSKWVLPEGPDSPLRVEYGDLIMEPREYLGLIHGHFLAKPLDVDFPIEPISINQRNQPDLSWFEEAFIFGLAEKTGQTREDLMPLISRVMPLQGGD